MPKGIYKRVTPAGMSGKKHSEETKKIISDKIKKYFLLPENRKKQSLAHMGQASWSKGKKLPERSGTNHPLWKGSDAGRGSIHYWITQNKTKPKKCEICGTINKLELSNKDHSYKRDITEYKYLCRSCHRKFDFRYNGLISNLPQLRNQI
jgi:hypothetical protein